MKVVRLLSSGAMALALAASLAATPALARDRISPGAAAAIGVLGGLAIGGAIAASQAPAYAAPAPVYVAPPPPPPPRTVYVERPATVYVERPPVVVQECYTESTREYVPGWGWQTRRRTVCP